MDRDAAFWQCSGRFRSRSRVERVLGGGEEFVEGSVIPSHFLSGVKGKDGNLTPRHGPAGIEVEESDLL